MTRHVLEDNEIQFLYQTPSAREPFLCQFCPQDLQKQTAKQRQAHYEHHLTEEPQVSSGSTEPQTVTARSDLKPSSKTSNPWTLKRYNKENDPFWYSSKTDPPPSNFTPCLIPILRKALEKSHSKGYTRRGALCYDKTVHIARDIWDANWGCGHRNFLMVCTALMDQQIQPMYYPLLDTPISPSVRNLQSWIEAAWEAGFDEEGAEQLKKLVGTNKWVGTSDLWVAFIFRGIPARLVDFNLKNNTKGVDVVTDWVVDYFTPPEQRNHSTIADALRGATAVTSTEHMPIILQHEGHSRTIVGYEISKSGAVNLLVFDPSKRPGNSLRTAALASHVSSKSQPPSKAPHFSPSPHDRGSMQSAPSSTKRRRANDSFTSTELAIKRSRSEDECVDDEVIIIRHSMGNGRSKTEQHYGVKSTQEEDLNPADVLSFFRINPKKLSRKSRYQILYFPLQEPLDDTERLSNKTVVSNKVC